MAQRTKFGATFGQNALWAKSSRKWKATTIPPRETRKSPLPNRRPNLALRRPRRRRQRRRRRRRKALRGSTNTVLRLKRPLRRASRARPVRAGRNPPRRSAKEPSRISLGVESSSLDRRDVFRDSISFTDARDLLTHMFTDWVRVCCSLHTSCRRPTFRSVPCF